VKHGTASAYNNHKCRCLECKAANSARERDRTRAKLYKRWESKFVDAAPVRSHLEALVKQGWGTRTIALKSGVHRTQIINVLYGRSSSDPRPAEVSRVLKVNAEKLLALRFDTDVPDGVSVGARGMHRRMQALTAQGFSLSWQARQIGWSMQNYSQLLKRSSVSAATFNKVKNLFEAYEMRWAEPKTQQEKAAVTRALRMAHARNWVVAAAWDDIDRDEHPPVPLDTGLLDEVIVEDLLDGVPWKVPHGTKLIYLVELLRRGASPQHCREVMHVSSTTLTKAMELRDSVL